MVLHAEHRQLPVAQPLAGAVVQVDVARLPAAARQGGRVDGEVVVLRRDLHAPGGEILHRVVGAMMAERQLVRASAGGQPEDLVAEADSKNRYFADQSANGLDEVRNSLWITGPIRQEDP